MLFYSEKNKKFYKTEEELKKAEKEFDAKQEEINALAKAKKSDAKAVEKAFKHSQEVRQAAADMIKEADDEYYKLKNSFIDKYGSFHMTVSEHENGTTKDNKESDMISDLNNILSNWSIFFWDNRS